MSIASAITAAQGKVAAAYTAVSNKGGTMPATQNLSNLPTAISSISGGGGASYVPPMAIVNGVYKPANSITTYAMDSTATSVSMGALAYSFYNCTNLTSADLGSLTSLNTDYACMHMFENCTGLTTADLGGVTTINGNSACTSMFAYCNTLSTIDLSSVTTINGSAACRNMFDTCVGLTSVDLSSLTEIGGSWLLGQMCYEMFAACYNLASIDLSSLEIINSGYACQRMFRDCTSLTTLSFPALTSQSFGSFNTQFNNMLSGCSGVTVHFPSNLQSVIGSWSDVTNGFDGTNTTVLFDLPATE